MYSKLLHRYTAFLIFSVVILIIAGGLVTSTKSGLAVPDWPNTYGYNMYTFPPSMWVGGIFYEHLHRLIASGIGFLTIILVFLTHKFEQRKWVKKLSLIALVTVCFQGLLGGLTVLFLLPDLISTFHATLAQTFFCLIITTHIIQTKWWHNQSSFDNSTNLESISKLSKISLIVFGIIYFQLIFGAWMRHTESGLAVPDFPLSYGQIFPSLNSENLEKYNNLQIEKNIRLYADGPLSSFQIMYHMIHRTWAYVVVIGIIFLFSKLKKTSNNIIPKKIKTISLVLILMVCSQFILGILTVLTRKSVFITTTHVVLGALTLGLTWGLTLFLLRMKKVASSYRK